MAFKSWRGDVGVIKPTLRPGSLEEFIRLMPEGVGVLPLFANIRQGSVNEFRQAVDGYEPKVAELAGLGVDVVHPEGAPLFMMLGFAREAEVARAWEAKYKTQIVTATQTQVEAMRALGLRSICGVSYLAQDVNEMAASYFRGAGFDVLGFGRIEVPFEDVGKLSSQQVYAVAKRAFLEHPQAEGIYLFGSGWRTLDIVELLERDLGVPVVHAVPARVWSIQKRLRVRVPVCGYGRLLAEFP